MNFWKQKYFELIQEIKNELEKNIELEYDNENEQVGSFCAFRLLRIALNKKVQAEENERLSDNLHNNN